MYPEKYPDHRAAQPVADFVSKEISEHGALSLAKVLKYYESPEISW